MTHFLLTSGFPDLPVILFISLAGAPMSAISVSSYQLAAQTTYPVNEVFGVGIMNTVNKLVTFGIVMLSNYVGPVMSLPMWAFISILGVIPALFYTDVKEDLSPKANDQQIKNEILTLSNPDQKPQGYGSVN